MATYLITSKAEKEEAAAIEALRPRRPAPYPANPRKFEGQYILPCGVTVPAREIMEIKGYVLHKNGRYTIYNQADMPINLDTTREVWAFFRLIDSVRPSPDERDYQDRGFVHPLTMIKPKMQSTVHERESKDNWKIRLDGPMNGNYHLVVLEYALVDTNARQFVTRHEERIADHTEALAHFEKLADRVRSGQSPIPFPSPQPEPQPEPEPNPPIAAQVHLQTTTCGCNGGAPAIGEWPSFRDRWLALPGGNGTKSTLETLAAIERTRNRAARGADLQDHRHIIPRDTDRYENGVGVDVAEIKSDLIDKLTAISRGKRPVPGQFVIIAGSWRVERSNGPDGVLELFHASRRDMREPIGTYNREAGSEFWQLTGSVLDPIVRRLVTRIGWTVQEKEEDLEELPF